MQNTPAELSASIPVTISLNPAAACKQKEKTPKPTAQGRAGTQKKTKKTFLGHKTGAREAELGQQLLAMAVFAMWCQQPLQAMNHIHMNNPCSQSWPGWSCHTNVMKFWKREEEMAPA